MRIESNALFQSDCVTVLERLDSEQVQLIYIDPPWYSEPYFAYSSHTRGAKTADGVSIHGRQAEASEGGLSGKEDDSERLRGYLVFLSKVVQQSHRILRTTGTLFFHTRPPLTNSVRLILDQVFGSDNLRQEIVWPQRKVRGLGGGRQPAAHDTILFYSKAPTHTYNTQYRPLSETEIKQKYTHEDDGGPYQLQDLTVSLRSPVSNFEWKGVQPPLGRSWRYSRGALDDLEASGRILWDSARSLPRLKAYLIADAEEPVGSIWDDIRPGLHLGESVRFPTQRPIALADRIIKMGSDEGELVVDPFAGSGTTLISAQILGRRWLGCELSATAHYVAAERIRSKLGLQPGIDFSVDNESNITSLWSLVSSGYLHVATSTRDLDRTHRMLFVLNEPVQIEETRHYEFKEVKGIRPVDAIKNTADEYVVAFLNSEGGRIYWGIRNSDRTVVGVQLTLQERDEVRRVVTEKLNAIRPAIDPTSYRVEMHQVYEGSTAVPDLCVVEIIVPRVFDSGPYFTGSNEMFVKTDGGKKKLSGPEQFDWYRRHRGESRSQ